MTSLGQQAGDSKMSYITSIGPGEEEQSLSIKMGTLSAGVEGYGKYTLSWGGSLADCYQRKMDTFNKSVRRLKTG